MEGQLGVAPVEHILGHHSNQQDPWMVTIIMMSMTMRRMMMVLVVVVCSVRKYLVTSAPSAARSRDWVDIRLDWVDKNHTDGASSWWCAWDFVVPSVA